MMDEILKYSEGFMNEEEKQAFEQKLTSDKELQEQYNLNQSLDKFLIKQVELDDIKDHVSQAFDEVEQESKSKTRALYYKWASIAASLLITIMVTTSVITKSVGFIYNQNFELYAPAKITRGSENNEKLIYLTGLYVKGQFKEVVQTYNQLPHAVAMDPTVSLMYGCALMELENFDKAIVAFDRIDTNSSSLMKADVQWYQGLCYLKIKDFDRAKNNFLPLKGSKKYASRAKKIIAKLD